MNKRKTGTEYENCAADYLAANGMHIKERNYRNRSGEIDLIGIHQGYLVFVEVKYRSGAGYGYASAAVTPSKQRQICKVADYYRMTHGVKDSCPIRYDVVAIQGDTVEWLQNAFPHVRNGR